MPFLLVDNAYEQNVACFWYSVLNAKVLVANINREMALVGAFSMIVKTSRRFVSISSAHSSAETWFCITPVTRGNSQDRCIHVTCNG